MKWKEKKISEELAGKQTAVTSFPLTTMENLMLSIMAGKEECPRREVQQTGGENDLGNELGKINNCMEDTRSDCGTAPAPVS